MTYELHTNGVITGSLNSFCLACGIFLNSQQSAIEHIGTSDHRKKLDTVQYSEKFQGEHIKKFKAGYYCEFCNVLMPIEFKVNLHINEDEHKHNKRILLLKPLNSDVIDSNNITTFIDKAWHGLIDGVFSLCNEEFDDETEHKTDVNHSLNLVLKPTQFGVDNAIFPHLDDTAVQCLTCNKVLAPGKMTKHFDDTEHQNLCNKRCIKPNRRQNFGTKENCDNNATNITLTDTDSSVSHNNSPKTPPGENIGKCSQGDARDFARANKISYGDNDQSFCRICKVNVPASLRALREHVEGANHKRLAVASQNASSTFSTTRPKAPRKQMKQSTKKFVYSTYDKREFCFTASIINEEFCILINSFYLIIENSSCNRCIVCEVNLPLHSDLEAHVTSRQHIIKWLAVPVIISEKNEFIREVRPGLYHCGYCNIVVAGWGEMKLHLECSEHLENRTLAEHELRLYYPSLQQLKMQLDSEALNARTC